MRHFLLAFILCSCSLNLAAYTLPAKTGQALAAIEDGYITHGVQQLRQSAAVNDIAAQFFMAICHEHGIAMPKDEQAAFGMYRRAAERGLPAAMKELARCYREGIGVAANDTRADEWLERAARKPDTYGLPDFIAIYNTGTSHPGNFSLTPGTSQPVASTKKPVPTAAPAQAPAAAPVPIQAPASKKQAPASKNTPRADVDVDIPASSAARDNTFALIIANENYQDVVPVSNALNDGEVLARYCNKTLGIPSTNIHLVKDATLNNIKREINLMKQIADAYGGNASFIIYYAGHGIPDETTHNAYIMPVDGFGADLSTCYSLADFYKVLGEMPSKKTVILLDACFSGAVRGQGMLAEARGVAIKSKAGKPSGNTIVISSAQGDETAYPYEEKGHGLFTYYLLKILKDTKGNVTLGRLIDYVKDNVVKKSLIVNGKSQTPVATPAQTISADWQNWKIY